MNIRKNSLNNADAKCNVVDEGIIDSMIQIVDDEILSVQDYYQPFRAAHESFEEFGYDQYIFRHLECLESLKRRIKLKHSCIKSGTPDNLFHYFIEQFLKIKNSFKVIKSNVLQFFNYEEGKKVHESNAMIHKAIADTPSQVNKNTERLERSKLLENRNISPVNEKKQIGMDLDNMKVDMVTSDICVNCKVGNELLKNFIIHIKHIVEEDVQNIEITERSVTLLFGENELDNGKSLGGVAKNELHQLNSLIGKIDLDRLNLREVKENFNKISNNFIEYVTSKTKTENTLRNWHNNYKTKCIKENILTLIQNISETMGYIENLNISMELLEEEMLHLDIETRDILVQFGIKSSQVQSDVKYAINQCETQLSGWHTQLTKIVDKINNNIHLNDSNVSDKMSDARLYLSNATKFATSLNASVINSIKITLAKLRGIIVEKQNDLDELQIDINSLTKLTDFLYNQVENSGSFSVVYTTMQSFSKPEHKLKNVLNYIDNLKSERKMIQKDAKDNKKMIDELNKKLCIQNDQMTKLNAENDNVKHANGDAQKQIDKLTLENALNRQLLQDAYNKTSLQDHHLAEVQTNLNLFQAQLEAKTICYNNSKTKCIQEQISTLIQTISQTTDYMANLSFSIELLEEDMVLNSQMRYIINTLEPELLHTQKGVKYWINHLNTVLLQRQTELTPLVGDITLNHSNINDKMSDARLYLSNAIKLANATNIALNETLKATFAKFNQMIEPFYNQVETNTKSSVITKLKNFVLSKPQERLANKLIKLTNYTNNLQIAVRHLEDAGMINEQTIKELNVNVRKQSEEITILNLDNNKLKVTNGDVQKQIKMYRENLDKISKENASTMKLLQETIDKISSQNDELSEAKRNLSSSQKHSEHLEKMLEDAKNEFNYKATMLETSLKNYKSAHEKASFKLQRESSAKNRLKDTLTTFNKSVENSNSLLRKQLHGMSSEMETCRQLFTLEQISNDAVRLYIQKSLERIEEIENKANSYKEEIVSLKSNYMESNYLHIKEMLVRCLCKLDRIDSRDRGEIREKRKNVVTSILRLQTELQTIRA